MRCRTAFVIIASPRPSGWDLMLVPIGPDGIARRSRSLSSAPAIPDLSPHSDDCLDAFGILPESIHHLPSANSVVVGLKRTRLYPQIVPSIINNLSCKTDSIWCIPTAKF